MNWKNRVKELSAVIGAFVTVAKPMAEVAPAVEEVKPDVKPTETPAVETPVEQKPTEEQKPEDKTEDPKDELMKRLESLENVYAEIDKRVTALETIANENKGVDAEVTEAVQQLQIALVAVQEMQSKAKQAMRDPALAVIGKGVSAKAVVTEANSNGESMYDLWHKMPAGKAKNDFLIAHAEAINNSSPINKSK